MGKATDDCMGYWDSNLDWQEGKFSLQKLMVDDFVKPFKSSDK